MTNLKSALSRYGDALTVLEQDAENPSVELMYKLWQSKRTRGRYVEAYSSAKIEGG